MKTKKTLYWIFTLLIVLFEGVMPALTGNSDLAKEGIRHLGYPDYFRVALTCFKVVGSLLLMLPQIKGRWKEWVYAGFSFDFIFAAISHAAVDGFSFQVIFPLLIWVVLWGSYYYYHQLQAAPKKTF